MKLHSLAISTAFFAAHVTSQEYYPNWASGGAGPHICLVANANETVPAGAPLFVSLEECCSTHYGWNFDACIGNDGPSGQYFPNWGSSPGSPETCLLDDGTHNVPKSTPTYADLSTCCSFHYLWKVDSCNNADLGPSNRYFPNWGNTPHVCVKDDGTNVIPSGAPFYDDLASCCANQYPWNLNECNDASPNIIFAETKITSDDQPVAQLFGHSVSIEGNIVAVGAPGDSNSTGTTYVFYNINGTWTQVGKIHASDAAAGDRFGGHVDVYQDDVIIVGAPSKNESRGAVYSFDAVDPFSEGLIIAPDDLPPNSFFGTSTAVVQDIVLIVGAPGQNALHILFAGVHPVDTYIDNDLSGLGYSQVYGEEEGILAVGAPSANGTGAIAIFAVEEEIDPTVLIPSDAQTGMQFGWALDVDDFVIAVGAPQHNVIGPASGAVYVYQDQNRDINTTLFVNYTQVTRLTPSDAQAGDEFGYSVVVRDDTIYVGAPGRNGAVYIFRRTNDGTWREASKIVALDATNGNMFGSSLDASDEYLLIGSPRDDGNASNSTDSGSVYIIELA